MDNQHVLVTGADGFIGSHLVEALIKEGARVTALCQYNAFNHWGWLEAVEGLEQVTVVCGDVRDPHYCRQITRGIDTVFHLAALIAIPHSYTAPDSYFETNVKGTVNMCQAALENGCERFIQTSTSEVYGTAQYVPIDENHPLQAQSPYSASKIGADAAAMSFYRSYGLPVIVARPFNTYGPRQSARAVIPTIITQIANNAAQIKLGDLTPTRDFNYVEDTCQALIALASCSQAIGREVNIGSNFEISIGDTLNLIRQIMQSDVEFVSDYARKRPRTSEVYRLYSDNTLLRELTGFVPEYTLAQGLKLTCEWFADKANLAQYKSEIYNV